jgi:hypothetical protein
VTVIHDPINDIHDPINDGSPFRTSTSVVPVPVKSPVPTTVHPAAATAITLALEFSKLTRHFLRDASGATSIEYGLIAAGISVASLP